MLTVTRNGKYISIDPGSLRVIQHGQTDAPDGIRHDAALWDNLLKYEKSRKLSLGSLTPQITYGVDVCNLGCPYCLNDSSDQNGLFSVSKYGTNVQNMVRLMTWISQTNNFKLGWAVGDPLTAKGLAFMDELADQTPAEVSGKCETMQVQTNGIHMDKFRDNLFSGWARRRLFWTTSLLSMDAKSHRSVEKHFDQLMDLAHIFREIKWYRCNRFIIPTDVDIKTLPPKLIDRAIEFLYTCRPNIVEPFNLIYLEMDRAKKYHSDYYPNIPYFVTQLEKSGIMDFFGDWFSEFEKHPIPVTMYNKIIQKDSANLYLLPDCKRVVDTDALPDKSYREIMDISFEHLLDNVDPMCLNCDAFSYCSVKERKDTQMAFDLGENPHLQYRDNCCHVLYIYALMKLKEINTETY